MLNIHNGGYLQNATKYTDVNYMQFQESWLFRLFQTKATLVGSTGGGLHFQCSTHHSLCSAVAILSWSKGVI